MTNIEKIIKIVLRNDFDNSFKTIWRMTKGSRPGAIKLITDLCVKHYGMPNVTEGDIDNALAEMSGGCEIEWFSE